MGQTRLVTVAVLPLCVAGPLSVPALLLADMVPERRAELEARAAEFARQRMVCGVHFASDLAAGRQAAEWLLRALHQEMEYSREGAAAARAASASRSSARASASSG